MVTVHLLPVSSLSFLASSGGGSSGRVVARGVKVCLTRFISFSWLVCGGCRSKSERAAKPELMSGLCLLLGPSSG